ncbi:MAG: beta-lactamase family protein [Haliscomenobacter sp.]|nr:beta-lactamase family protein [Haliscomenobacter sp.]
MYKPLLLLLWLLPACAPAQSNLAQKIDQVERNLLPKIKIAGDPANTYTIQERMAHYQVPGVSIAVLNNGQIEWAKGYGFTGQDSLRRITPKTLFQAASISKPVAALAALLLVEEGKIGLDQDVNTYLKTWKVPENAFTEKEKVTLRRLLTHTAGLTVHGFRGYALGEKIPTSRQILNGEPPANSAKIFPDTFPGAIWRYSGGGYTVMQQLVADVSGIPFPEFMEARVLKKIGMKNSAYYQPLPFLLRSRASLGHRSDGKKVTGDWHTYPEMAAAGLWTTPTDLLKYAMAVQNMGGDNPKGLLSKETAGKMLSKDKSNWGLGPSLSGEGKDLLFSHGGSNEGFKCAFFAFAYKGQGVAVMTNGDGGSALVEEIFRSVSRVYGWNTHSQEEKTLLPLSSDSLLVYEGRYRLNDDMYADVKIEGKLLALHPSWDPEKVLLYPEKKDLFFSMTIPGPFIFLRDPNNRIMGMFNRGTQLKKEP